MNRRRLLILAGLWLAFARLAGMAVALSATVDEGFHITSGNEYLHTGHVRLLDEHTPLVKAWMALPLLPLDDLTPPQEAPGYAEGDLIGVAQATTLAYRPLDRVIVPPRLMIALLTVLLLATILRRSERLFGPWGGTFAFLLAAADPNLLAHGALATTDLGATAFIFWATWAFADALQRGGKRRWAMAALLLGLAQLAKLTALLLIPLLGLMALVAGWEEGKLPRERRFTLNGQRGGKYPKHRFFRPVRVMRLAIRYVGVVAGAALVVWAGYGFEVRPLEGWGGGLPLPAASHFERLLRLRENLAYGRESFLLGQNGMHGWPLYFPLAFLVKTPPLLLLLLLPAALLSLRRLTHWRERMALWLFPALYFLSALTSTIDIGYRHLLPLLPFLYVAVGSVGAWVALRPRPLWRWAAAGGVAATLLAGLAIHPWALSYFNLLAGGAEGGWRFLADSNTDWGQALKALAEAQRRGEVGEVRLSQFLFYDPAAYGVRYEPIAPMEGAPPVLPRRFDPAPGLYAISATTLDGVPLPYPPTYDWFRHREPWRKLGYALFLYRVEPSGGEWVAQCTDPAPPLTGETVAEGFGRDDLRQLTFDCTQTWVIPQGRGWYARLIPAEGGMHWPRPTQRLDLLPAWTGALDLSALQLSYLQPQAGELPPFALWAWAGGVLTPTHRPAAGAVDFGGVIRFLGYDLRGEGEVLTCWRVLRTPDAPLSLMLHLRTAAGETLAVGDALGFPAEQWRAGDLIIQRHSLTLPAGAGQGDCLLAVGAYTWPNLQPLLTHDGLPWTGLPCRACCEGGKEE